MFRSPLHEQSEISRIKSPLLILRQRRCKYRFNITLSPFYLINGFYTHIPANQATFLLLAFHPSDPQRVHTTSSEVFMITIWKHSTIRFLCLQRWLSLRTLDLDESKSRKHLYFHENPLQTVCITTPLLSYFMLRRTFVIF